MQGGFVFVLGNNLIEALHDSSGFNGSSAFAHANLYELILLRGGEREIGHGEFFGIDSYRYSIDQVKIMILVVITDMMLFVSTTRQKKLGVHQI